MASVWGFAKKQLLQSMLTGIPQIIRARRGIRKMLKSLVLIGCFIGCAYQILSFMMVYWSYPVIVDVFVSNPSHVTPPAFTICEYNGLRRSRFCNKFPDLCTPKRSYVYFCNQHFALCRGDPSEPKDKKVPALPPQELPTNISNPRTVYRSLGTREHEFINYVYYGNEELHSKLVSTFNIQALPTNCFAFNIVWGNSSARLTSSRLTTGFQMGLEMNGGENFYTSTPRAIQMAVHSPFMKVNPFTEGFSIRPCTTYKMFLQKTIKYLLPAPYITNCTDYEELWRMRGGYGPLNKKMCFDECVFNRSMEKYGCFNPTEIAYPNENEPFCFSNHIQEKDVEYCSRNCQPACYEEEMQIKIEELVFPDTEGEKNSEKCLTGISLSLIRTQVMTFTYSRKYQVVEAFGYIGGFLGMWMGLSLIAVCDFLETCLMILKHACGKWKGLRKKKITPNTKTSKKKIVFFI